MSMRVCMHKRNCQLIMLAWLAQTSVLLVETLYLYGPAGTREREQQVQMASGCTWLHAAEQNTHTHMQTWTQIIQ